MSKDRNQDLTVWELFICVSCVISIMLIMTSCNKKTSGIDSNIVCTESNLIEENEPSVIAFLDEFYNRAETCLNVSLSDDLKPSYARYSGCNIVECVNGNNWYCVTEKGITFAGLVETKSINSAMVDYISFYSELPDSELDRCR